MASREREEEGSQRKPKGTKRKPNESQMVAKGCQRGAKRKPRRNQKRAKMKKAPPKVSFADFSRNRSRTVGGNDARRMTMFAKMKPKPMPKLNTNQCKAGTEQTHENHDKC